MFKRDNYTGTTHDAVAFSKWQDLFRSRLLGIPLTETAELRKPLANYISLSRDLGPKILIGGDDREVLRKGTYGLGRYRAQRSIPNVFDLGVATIGHDQGRKDDLLVANLGRAESTKSQIPPYCTRHDFLDKKEYISQTKPSLSQTRNENKKLMFENERENSYSEAEERPQDKQEDGSDSATGCGVLLEDGTACTLTPVKGRKRCRAHKGQRISTRRECKEAEEICGVILPDMIPCRTKPVSGRKRCEDHKGMRVNAFFFLWNPIEKHKIVKEDHSKPEDLGPGPFCEGTTKNGLPCKRNAPKGSRRCWQHNDENLDHSSSKNVQTATRCKEMCGVKVYNGLPCENSPVNGRKRCEVHKGMRITS